MPARCLVRILYSCVLVASLGVFTAGARISGQDRGQFDKETDPVRKAKLFQKLGETQMSQFNKQAADADYDMALQTLSVYRDEARTVFDGLRATGVDPERHSDGFRHLQIALRKGIWQFERTLPVIPDDRRTAFNALGDNLIDMQTQLEHMLFPRDAGTPKGKPGA